MALKRKYFPDLWRELNSENPVIRSAYLFYGPEEFLARKALGRISELCGEVRPFDVVESSGIESSVAEVADELNTLPMIAARRLIAISQAEKLLSKVHRGGKMTREGAYLRDTIRNPGCTGCLVLMGSPEISLPAMPGGKLLSDLVCIGVYPLKEGQLLQWVEREAKRRGLEFSEKARYRLIALAGPSLMDLENELDKLSAYAMDVTGVVDEELVNELTGGQGGSIQDFVEAVASRDFARAMILLDHLLLVPKNRSRLFPALCSLFRNLHDATSMTSAEFFKSMPAWRARQVQAWARSWDSKTLLFALNGLFAAELAWKAGKGDPGRVLVQFIAVLQNTGTGSSPRGIQS